MNIVGYTYKAETFCDMCIGEVVRDDYKLPHCPEGSSELDAAAVKLGITDDPTDEYSYNSDEWPKAIFRSQLDPAANGIEYCSNCHNCLACGGWSCDYCDPEGS